MRNPKVSVIMPAYNHEKFIGQAIESVLNQTFEDLEFIIVNDGSTDGTEQVIKDYKDERINYNYQENQGAHKAINRGISLAKGDYISIINSDDIYHPERLSTLVEIAKEKEAKFIFTDLSFISEDTVNINLYSKWIDKLKTAYLNSKSLDVTFLSGNIAVTTSNFFFKSALINVIGEFAPYRYVHDYDFALRALHEYPEDFLYLADKKLLSYRVHSNNTIRESLTAVHIETIKLLLQKTPNFIQSGEDKTCVESSLNYIERSFEDLIKDIKHKDQMIDGLFNTMSWKITAPLRWVYGQYLLYTKHKRR